jgi:chromosome segregation ATPase
MSLETDIETLRERVSNTQQLYREVCVLLFFRYGETPTANKLYQLVRKGSMSAPAKALRDFWIDVRKKTRVDVGQPDLPAEVAAAAGELASRLWQLAAEAAQQGLHSFQQEAQLEVANARQIIEATKHERDTAREDAQRATNSAVAEKRRTAELGALLVREQAANTLLRDEVARARSETGAAGNALADARRDFAGELEKLRMSLAQNDQRLVAAERRALLEIENERTIAARARKDLAAASERLADVETAQRAERDGLRDELATLKTQIIASREQVDHLRQSLDAKQAEIVDRDAEIDIARQELHLASVRRARSSDSVESTRRRQRMSRRTRSRVEFSVGPINHRPIENS